MSIGHPRRTVAVCVNSAWNVLNFRRGLVRDLVSNGFRVVVLAPLDQSREPFEQLGCEVTHIDLDRGSLSPLHDLRVLLQIRRELKRLRPIVMLGFTIKPNVYGSLAARSLGIPVINNVAGLGTMFLRGRLAAALARLFYWSAFRKSYVVFFQNPDDHDMFIRRGIVRSEQARLLPGSGIDLARFMPDALPGADERQPVVFLMIARLLRDKGVAEYIGAARHLRKSNANARFVLVGGHDLKNSAAISTAVLNNAISEAAIEYVGQIADVRKEIAKADCIVLPSYREGLPRTLLEGAAMGRPLVATDVPGCREVVRDETTGILCRPRDPKSLATALKRMIDAGALERQRMGSNARRMVENQFDERFVASAYREALNRLVDS